MQVIGGILMGVSCREWRRTRLALIELELELGKLVLSIREKITQAPHGR